jgi:hypothetical protein
VKDLALSASEANDSGHAVSEGDYSDANSSARELVFASSGSTRISFVDPTDLCLWPPRPSGRLSSHFGPVEGAPWLAATEGDNNYQWPAEVDV